MKDAEWIAQLLEHGLLRPSFVPPPEIRQLRNLTRYRLQVMGDRTRDAGRLEKLLEDASIKLSVVASNITGRSARAMLGALVAGERGPVVMEDFARNRMRRRLSDLAEALTGRFDEHHALLVGSLLPRLEHTEMTLRELDAEIVARMAPWDHQLELLSTIPGAGGDHLAGVHRRDWGRHVSVRVRRAVRCVGRGRAGRARVGWQAHSRRDPAGQQVPHRDARRGRELRSTLQRHLPLGAVQTDRVPPRARARPTRSRTPCSCWPTGCSSATSPIRTSAPTGCLSATTKRTHGASSRSSNDSATPSCLTLSPSTGNRGNSIRGSASGLRPDAVAPWCSSFSGQSNRRRRRRSRASSQSVATAAEPNALLDMGEASLDLDTARPISMTLGLRSSPLSDGWFGAAETASNCVCSRGLNLDASIVAFKSWADAFWPVSPPRV